MATLSELRDALSALGVSTSTDNLRGEERRLELLKRFQEVRSRSHPDHHHDPNLHADVANRLQHEKVHKVEDDQAGQMDTFQRMALGELRRALEDRGLSTQTPGLKGEARRHALTQRLVNTQTREGGSLQQPPSSACGKSRGSPGTSTAAEAAAATGRASEAGSDLDLDGADTKSVSSSSSYSTATEFLFFDLPSGRNDDEPSDKQRPRIPVLALDRQQEQLHRGGGDHNVARVGAKSSFCAIERLAQSSVGGSGGDPTSSFVADDNHQQPRDLLQDELFELRKKLHRLRGERQQQLDKCMRDAGFAVNLEALSAALETLEKERHRLMTNYFAHELVTSTVLRASPSPQQQSVELVQEDAIRLLDKRQDALRRQVQQTKAALEIVKQRLDDDGESSNNSSEQLSGCEDENELTVRIQSVKALLREHANEESSSISDAELASWRSSASSTVSTSSSLSAAAVMAPVLVRCRSAPSAMFKETWNELQPEQKQQLHQELRAAASSRIQRDRVSLGGQFGPLSSRATTPILLSSDSSKPPSQADKLGIKALFLEHTRRNVLETSRTYQQAITLNKDHAVNLGNYARFLYVVCGNVDQAQEHFELALRADPLHALNLMNYANFLKRARHNMDQAEKYYQQALRLNPNDVNLLGNYANLLFKKRKSKKESDGGHESVLRNAKELLELALRIAPGHVKNRLQYAAVLSALSETAAAEQCYEQLIQGMEGLVAESDTRRRGTESKELAHVYGNYANFLLKRERWEKAKQMYMHALRLLPQHPLLLRNL